RPVGLRGPLAGGDLRPLALPQDRRVAVPAHARPARLLLVPAGGGRAGMTDVPALVAAGDLSFLDADALNEWIVAQRWFASKTRQVDHIAIASAVPLRTEAPLFVLCLVEARFPSGTHETYQLPLGLRPADDGWGDRVILEVEGWVVYDALADPA